MSFGSIDIHPKFHKKKHCTFKVSEHFCPDGLVFDENIDVSHVRNLEFLDPEILVLISMKS